MDGRDIDSNRRRSFGRGGAGNIRSYSNARLPDQCNEDGTWRRRSSILSSRSSDSAERKRTSLLHGWSEFFQSKRDLKADCIHEEPKVEELEGQSVGST
ncbi:hypothetical protein HYQ46_000825 [Verticillium longisporum]|nr:hypothetical protein HYQ44_004612 [Verticillium longisporum]KAG7150236.1 hypothetical protein HYQ46_000825 [Verticillium longisporum]